MTIFDMINNDEVTFEQFYTCCMDNDLGDWDNVNSTNIIYDYINEQMRDGTVVSHILRELETESSSKELWKIWLGNNMETPKPINSKEDLANALGLEERGYYNEEFELKN